jgi:hypothetical protein
MGDCSPPPSPPIAIQPHPRKRFEVSSVGFDENLLLTGSSPYGDHSWMGLRVPTLGTASLTKPQDNRYLFNCAAIEIPEGRRFRLLGYRKFVSIGELFTPDAGPPAYVVEFEVTSPFWRFPDNGNVSWHLMRIGRNEYPQPRAILAKDRAPSLIRDWSLNPAMLYNTITLGAPGIYPTLTAYTAPRKGRPWGSPLVGDLGTRHDLEVPWRSPVGWRSFGDDGIEVEGNCTVALFASVFQTTVGSRVILNTAWGRGQKIASGIAPEDAFLMNFANAIYWRVGGSLMWEEI